MLRHDRYCYSLRALRCTVATLALLGAVPAFAQQAPTTGGPTAASSDSAMVNLVRLLIEQGVLTPEKGAVLMQQAQAEATRVRGTPTPSQQASTDLPPPPAGTVRVPYVPETVRTQIKDELRSEVLAQAKAEGWASPAKAAPEWVDNLKIYGDLRLRAQTNLYSKTNGTGFLDVGEFNATGPYDFATQFVPSINTFRNRYNLIQLRARLGLEAKVADRFTIGMQLATGDDSSPISTNAALGGGFRKRDVWLQLAYLKGDIIPGVSAIVGRFDNPFRHTDLVFDPDLSFDGVSASVDVGKIIGSDYSVAVRGGAFPLDFGDVDFPSRSTAKRNFRDRYLLSGQLDVGRRFDNGLEVHLSGAYHDFTYLRGHVSQPCDVYSVANVECSTDAQRPFFASKGNTIFLLRRFDTTFADPANPFQPQFLGLKFAYRVIDANGSVGIPISDRVSATFTGNYVRNIGFDRKNICNDGIDGQPFNNTGAAPANSNGVCDTTNPTPFEGGNQGYAGFVSLGTMTGADFSVRNIKAHDWSVFGGYKYLESDAVLDSFTDSDFHLGGTNAKGYVVGGRYAIFDNIGVSARWLSANEIAGAPLSIDVLQLNLEAAF